MSVETFCHFLHNLLRQSFDFYKAFSETIKTPFVSSDLMNKNTLKVNVHFLNLLPGVLNKTKNHFFHCSAILCFQRLIKLENVNYFSVSALCASAQQQNSRVSQHFATHLLYFGLMIYLHVDPFRARYHLTSCDKKKKTYIHNSVSDLTNWQ